MASRREIVFVTSSEFKQEENEIFLNKCKLQNGTVIKDLFDVEIREINVPEILEVDLKQMVEHEVRFAYEKIKVPCFVEHAGLIFEKYLDDGYPGGLTKPMWDSLGQKFIEETHSSGIKVVARAVVAYCDGLCIKTFRGETEGKISDIPKGERAFYWDTIFIPEDSQYNSKEKTFAELVKENGLEYKVVHLSQSTKAKIELFEYLYSKSPSVLW